MPVSGSSYLNFRKIGMNHLWIYICMIKCSCCYFREKQAKQTWLSVHLAALCVGITRFAPPEVERRFAARVSALWVQIPCSSATLPI